MLIPAAMRKKWGDYVWWEDSAKPQALTRDQVGRTRRSAKPCWRSVEVKLADGKTVRCRPVFDLVREYAEHLIRRPPRNSPGRPPPRWSRSPGISPQSREPRSSRLGWTEPVFQQ